MTDSPHIKQAIAQSEAEIESIRQGALALSHRFTLIGKDFSKCDVLRSWREELQLTQTEFGDFVGYSYGSISKFENGVEPVPKSIQFAMYWACEADLHRSKREEIDHRRMKRLADDARGKENALSVDAAKRKEDAKAALRSCRP